MVADWRKYGIFGSGVQRMAAPLTPPEHRSPRIERQAWPIQPRQVKAA